jgi:hypothetical protein
MRQRIRAGRIRGRVQRPRKYVEGFASTLGARLVLPPTSLPRTSPVDSDGEGVWAAAGSQGGGTSHVGYAASRLRSTDTKAAMRDWARQHRVCKGKGRFRGSPGPCSWRLSNNTEPQLITWCKPSKNPLREGEIVLPLFDAETTKARATSQARGRSAYGFDLQPDGLRGGT